MIAHANLLENACRRRDAWNQCQPPGTYVRFWQSMRAGEWMITQTTGEAFVHGRGVAVYVRGCVMPIWLTNLEPVSPETLDAIEHRPIVPRCRRDMALPVGDRGGLNG